MEQKDYTMEVVRELLREPCHIRELAKRISTNHMRIYRVVNKLLRANVLDYRKSGRNTAYFIKRTAEARSYVLMCESYKLLMLLGKYPALRSVIEDIQRDKRIKSAVVFGSYAKMSAKDDSDIDIYIETSSTKIKQELCLLDSKLSIKTGKYAKENLLLREIEKSHVIIKGVEDFYEKSGLLGKAV